jgi:hypothetical protein
LKFGASLELGHWSLELPVPPTVLSAVASGEGGSVFAKAGASLVFASLVL